MASVMLGLVLFLTLATALNTNDTGTTLPPSSPPPVTTTAPPPPTTAPAPSPTLSGCQVCAASGDCSHAYLDGPGQFCGNWLDKLSQRQRCCCPRDATCKVTNYECKCSRASSTTRAPSPNTPRATSNGSASFGGGLAVGFALLVCCCLGSFCCCGRRDASHPTRLFFGGTGAMSYDVLSGPKPGVVYAQPAPVYQPYAMPSMAPAYHPAYAAPYGYGHSSGGSSMAAGSLGAVAGLATGMMVANSFGHHHSDHYYYGGSGGGGYSGGGGDFGGDSGGGGDFGGDF